MARTLDHLLEMNRRWAEHAASQDSHYFERLVDLQAPQYLWIGCSDSRVPANQITGLQPGEVFVHRNVANVVIDTDLNCLSVLQFGIDVLGVRHVIVCGHYGCGGVGAALRGERLGLVDNWLRRIEMVRDRHAELIESAAASGRSADLLCELNVLEQVRNVCQTTVLRDAWRKGRDVTIHGWIYRLHDGRLHDLGVSIDGPADTDAIYRAALERLAT
jgi:carbonic anhydrase